VTLLSDGGLSLSQYAFTLMYDNVSGIRTSNPQDKWGTAVLFPPGTPVGTSNQVQLLAPTYFGFILYGPVPSSFPKGIPVQLIMRSYGGTRQDVWATASLGKDIPSNHFTDLHDTSVTYGLNNTATVTFLGTTGAGLSVALTNVCGSGLPSSEYRYCGDGAGLQWPC
jgi:hypothetical protein